MQRLGWASCKRFVMLQFGYRLLIIFYRGSLLSMNRLLSTGVTSRGSSYCLRHLSSSRLLKSPSGSKFASSTMAAKDTTLQSDISKMKVEADGSFKRADSSFRNTIAKGSRFEPEKGGFQCFMWLFLAEILVYLDRYHLYVSYACRTSSFIVGVRICCINWHVYTAWATRTLIVRKLKGLESIIRRLSILFPEVWNHTTYVSCHRCITSHGPAWLAFCSSRFFPGRRWGSIISFRTCEGSLH